MITKTKAKKVGRSKILLPILSAIIAGLLIMSYLSSYSFNWLQRFFAEVSILLVLLSIFGYVVGGIVGSLILVKGKNSRSTGVLAAVLLLLMVILTFGIINMVKSIFIHGYSDFIFSSYIFKPLFWGVFLGIVPAILIGLWYGDRVKKVIESNAELKSDN